MYKKGLHILTFSTFLYKPFIDFKLSVIALFIQFRFIKLTSLIAECKKPGSGCEVAGITPGSEEHVNLGLYGNRKDAFRLLQTECN